MSTNDEIILHIARELNILQGSCEENEHWKTRVIYSVLGVMGISALLDPIETNNDNTINHFKSRIKSTYNAYKTIFPDLNILVTEDDMCNELLERYLSAGYIYHAPNRLRLANFSAAVCNGMSFIRGASIDSMNYVSGLGYYNFNTSINNTLITEMFMIPNEHIVAACDRLLKEISWIENDSLENVEYLRLKEPFSSGYWGKNISDDRVITIVRAAASDSYYFYRRINGKSYISPIQSWRVLNGEYRRLAFGLIYENGNQPCIRYQLDGPIVHIIQEYLLPPPELNLLLVYSWPETYYSFPSHFRRCMAKPVFDSFKIVMEKLGYIFKKELL